MFVSVIVFSCVFVVKGLFLVKKTGSADWAEPVLCKYLFEIIQIYDTKLA